MCTRIEKSTQERLNTEQMIGLSKILEPIKQIVSNKDVLFIENDFDLYDAVSEFRDILTDLKIKYNTVLRVDKYDRETILELLRRHDVIVWESQYVTENEKFLFSLIKSDEFRPKTLIECVGYEPRINFNDSKHDFYFFRPMVSDPEEAIFVKLEKESGWWDKEDNEL